MGGRSPGSHAYMYSSLPVSAEVTPGIRGSETQQESFSTAAGLGHAHSYMAEEGGENMADWPHSYEQRYFDNFKNIKSFYLGVRNILKSVEYTVTLRDESYLSGYNKYLPRNVFFLLPQQKSDEPGDFYYTYPSEDATVTSYELPEGTEDRRGRTAVTLLLVKRSVTPL